MTAEEKTLLSKFLNLTLDYSGTGYARERAYSFEDDPPEAEVSEPALPPDSPSTLPESIPTALPLAYLVDEDDPESFTGENCLVIITGSNLNEQQMQLVDRMLASVGLSRNRNCFFVDGENSNSPSCGEQINLLKPKLIFCLGKNENLHIQAGNDIPVLATFHPKELLENEALKRPAFEDMKELMATLAGLDYEYKNEVTALLKKYAANDPDYAERIRELI